MPKEVSSVVPTALGSGAQKLGQPVPLSNLVVDEKRSSWQPAQPKIPARASCSSTLLKGGSVALSRSTAYWSGARIFCHSASLWVTAKASAARAAAHRGNAYDASPNAAPIRRKRLVTMRSASRSERARARVGQGDMRFDAILVWE